MKILCLIPTFERPQMLLDLLNDIQLNKSDNEIHLIIVNDGSTQNYTNVIEYLHNNFLFEYFKLTQNGGKDNYYKVVNYLYDRVRVHKDYDYYFQFADDLRLCKDYFDYSIMLYDSIEDDSKILLNTLELNELKNQAWHSKEIINYGDYRRSNWTDGCFISEINYFEALNYEVVNPVKKSISSGVGKYISQILNAQNYNIYTVNKSLALHDTHESVMHKEHRKIFQLTSN